MKEPDLILFNKIKKGNKEALESLFVKYYSSLCNFVNHLITDPESAEEIVSDVFFLIWAERKKLTIHSNTKSYLFTIARNKALLHIKKRPFISENIDSALNTEDFNNPETHLLFNELNTLYQRAYEALPSQCKLIFKMHKIDGLKYVQIAEVLNISIKTVENQMGKSLKLIREAILSYQLEKD
ncbi:RNA polymerase sigma-70 factor [Fulvivirga sediminis]|uniref:RNA polymerase sigma-70 factor n=1 Tax=Fulvivirga sediminis TaxID=2803949 RepID=A0A937FBJ5_9BACT|nr:RNA polymerase sigma-70 factor [Fulvivirga sediminis]MBL3657855.1 RNA polymerase sigma-70 factor [Fulvivirga sediminis]